VTARPRPWLIPGLVLAIIVAAALSLLAGKVWISPAELLAGDARWPIAVGVDVVRTGVDDFTFDSFDVEYRLGRDAEGRATLTTVETFVARFPDFDQNRGIRRSLPASYQGRTTSLEVVSVTDERGVGRPFEVDRSDGVVSVIAAVPEGSFVRGVQTYVITYTQRDVVDAFADTGAEEFYWNLNGTDWAQPFGSVRGTVVLDDGLADALLPGARGLRGPFTCLNSARYGIVWGAMGAARDALETARRYALERVAFERPIAAAQLTQAKLADMTLDVSTGTLLALQLGRLKDQGLLLPHQISIGKLNNVRTAIRVAQSARTILGGNGITAEYSPMRHVQNLESVRTYEGTDEVHALVIGAALTGMPAFR